MIFIVLMVLLMAKVHCQYPGVSTEGHSTVPKESRGSPTIPSTITTRSNTQKVSKHRLSKRETPLDELSNIFRSTEDAELIDEDQFGDGLALEADLNQIKIIIERDGDQLEVEYYDNQFLVGEDKPDNIVVEYEESPMISEEKTTTEVITTTQRSDIVEHTEHGIGDVIKDSQYYDSAEDVYDTQAGGFEGQLVEEHNEDKLYHAYGVIEVDYEDHILEVVQPTTNKPVDYKFNVLLYNQFSRIDKHPSFDGIFGMRAIKIGYRLRHNLINLFGFCMHQPYKDIGKDLFLHMHNLKTALQTNLIDVFKIIPTISKVYKQNLNQQVSAILQAISNEVKTCHIRCSANFIRRKIKSKEIDIQTILSRLSYNIITHDLYDRNNRRSIEEFISIGKKIDDLNIRIYKRDIFSPAIVKVLREMRDGEVMFTDEIVGYLLVFFPWPADEFTITNSVMQISLFLTTENNFMQGCKILSKNPNDIYQNPMAFLTWVFTKILDNACFYELHIPARILMVHSLQDNFFYKTNHKNFIELNAVGDLLDIITFNVYPVEVVLAKDRVKKYLVKISPFIDLKTFRVYLYPSEHSRLLAFLGFLANQELNFNSDIKSSIDLIMAYLFLNIGHQKVDYNNMVFLANAWISPDFMDDIHDRVTEVKYFLLHQREAIKKIETALDKSCGDMMDCISVGKQLIRQAAINNKFNFELPPCLIQRLMRMHYVVKQQPFDKSAFLHDITAGNFSSEVARAAKGIRDYFETPGVILTDIDVDIKCTKLEMLLESLKLVQQKMNDLPKEIISNLSIVIAELEFRLFPLKYDDILERLDIVYRDTEVHEVIKTSNVFLYAHGEEISKILQDIDSNSCRDLLHCYNIMADKINSEDFGYKLPYLTKTSPILDELHLKEDLTKMTVQKILEIIDLVDTKQTNEIVACTRYLLKHTKEINEVISKNNCQGSELFPCFQSIYANLLYTRGQHDKIKLNILRYLLKPTYCTSTTCEWTINEEKGSSLLNPLLEYLVTILEELSESIDSLHLQIDIYGVIDFMRSHNIDQVFEIFNLFDQTQEELIIYLLRILQLSSTTTQDIKISISNINHHLSKANTQSRANVVLLKGLGLSLAAIARTPEVATELEYRIIDIAKNEEEVLMVVSNLKPNCTEVMKCADDLLKSFHRPKGRIDKKIYRLLSPASCTVSVCPWLSKETESTTNDIVNRLIEDLNNKNKTLDTLDKLAVEKMLERDLAFEFLEEKPKIMQRILHDEETLNPVFIHPKKFWDMPENDEPDEEQKEEMLESQRVAIKQAPASPEYKHLVEHLQGLADNLTAPYDHFSSDSLQELLEEFHRISDEDYIRSRIEQAIELIKDNLDEVNYFLWKITIHCKEFEVCKRSLHDGLVNEGLENNEVFSVIIEILRGKSCTSICLHKMTLHQDQLYSLLEKIVEQLEDVHHPIVSSFQFHVDIKILQEFYKDPNLHATLHETYINNLSKSEFFLLNALKGLIEDSDATGDIKQSAKNVMGLLYDGFAPKTIHADHVDHMLAVYIGLCTDDKVRNELMFRKEDIQDSRVAVSELLEKVRVNCVSLESCQRTLERSLLEYKNEEATEMIISALRPKHCDEGKCPWLQGSIYFSIDDQKLSIATEVDVWCQNTQNYLLKVDFKQLKYVILAEDLVEYYLSLNIEYETPILGILQNMHATIKYRYDIVDSVNILIEYMTSNSYPSYVTYRQLRHICRRLRSRIDYYPAILSMEQAYDELRYEMDHIKTKLKEIKVNCKTFRKCVKELITGVEYMNDPISTMIRDALAPQNCPISKCSWLAKDSHDSLLKIIKTDLEKMIEASEVPLIIKLKILQIISKLQIIDFEKFEIPKSDITIGFLKLLISQNVDLTLARDIINYMENKTVSTTLNHKDLHLIIVEMIEISGDAMVKVHLENYQDLIFYFSDDVDEILGDCVVSCVNITECVSNLNECASEANTDFSAVLMFALNPQTCNETSNSCPWLDDQEDDFQSYDKVKITPHNIIIFPPKRYGSIPITLSLHDVKHVKELIKIFPTVSVENLDKRSTAIALHKRSSIRHILIDFSIPNVFKRLHAISSRRMPVINYKTFKNCIIALPMFHQEMRAFKFDLTLPGVKEQLKQAAQSSWRRKTKPTVTIIDFNESRYQLVIDIFDTEFMRKFLSATTDQVKSSNYGVVFWPRNFGEPWRCLADDVERGFVWNILDLYSIVDAGDSSTATQGMKLNINVFNSIFKKHLNSMSWGKPICTLQANKNYTFFLPSGATQVIGIDLNLKSTTVQKRLRNFSAKMFKNTSDVTAEIVNQGSVKELRLNFDSPNDFKTFQECVANEDASINTIGLISLAKGFIILLWEIPEVVDGVLELSKSSTTNINKTKIIIPYTGHFIEVFLDLNDEIVIEYLADLMQKTLKPFPLLKVNHTGKNFFVSAIIDDLRTTPIFIEESIQFQNQLRWHHKINKTQDLLSFYINDEVFDVDITDDDVEILLKRTSEDLDHKNKKYSDYKYYLYMKIPEGSGMLCPEEHRVDVSNHQGNSSFGYCTRDGVVTKKQSLVVFNIPNITGQLESIVLVLDSKTRGHLRALSRLTRPESTKKVAIHHMNEEMLPETIILDMDAVSIEDLRQEQACGLSPTEISHPAKNKNLIVVTHPKTCEALILDLHRKDTLTKLQSLADCNSTTYIPLTEDGKIIHVPIPYNENKTAFEELKKQFNFSIQFLAPSSNLDSMLSLKIIDEDEDAFIIALDTTDAVTQMVLEDITRIAPLTVPKSLVRGASYNYNVRLELEDTYVQDRLKEVAQQVFQIPEAEDLLVISTPEGTIIINAKKNVDELMRLTEEAPGNKTLYKGVILSRGRKKTMIQLDLKNHMKALRNFERHLKHSSKFMYKNQFLQLTIPSGDETFSTCLNLKRSTTISALIKENDPTNPKAIIIPIHRGVDLLVHLNPKKQSTRQTLIKHTDLTCWVNIKQAAYQGNIIEIPLETKTGPTTIECDLDKPGTLKKILALPSVNTTNENVLYFKDSSNNSEIPLYFDGGNQKLVIELKNICPDASPKPSLMNNTNIRKDTHIELFKPNTKEYTKDTTVIEASKPKLRMMVSNDTASRITVESGIVRKDRTRVLNLRLSKDKHLMDEFNFDLGNEHVVYGLEDVQEESFRNGDKVPIGGKSFLRINASKPAVVDKLRILQQLYDGDVAKKPTGPISEYSEEYVDDTDDYIKNDRPAFDIPDDMFDYEIDTEEQEEDSKKIDGNNKGKRKINHKSNESKTKEKVTNEGTMQAMEDFKGIVESLAYDGGEFLIDPPITAGDVLPDPPTTSPPIISGHIPNDKVRSISTSPYSLILMYVQEKLLTGVLIIDLNYEKVLNTLLDISSKLELSEATHFFMLEDSTTSKLIKINTRNVDTLTTLIELSKLTRTNLEPTAFPKSCGDGHYFVFTVLDEKREVQFIVIDIGYPKSVDLLKRVRIATGIKPLKIIVKKKPKEQYYFIDIANPFTVKELLKLTRSTPLCKEVLRNVPLEDEVFKQFIHVPIETSDGLIKEYTFDLNNSTIITNLITESKKIPKNLIACAFYTSRKGKTVVFKIVLSFPPPKTKPMMISQQIDAENVLLFFLSVHQKTEIVSVHQKTEIVILDKNNQNVTETLLNHKNDGQDYSVFNIMHHDGYPIEVRLNLRDEATIAMIKSLGEYTIKPFAPFEMVTTLGNKKITILCLENFNSEDQENHTIAVLNENNNDVFSKTHELFESNAWDLFEIIQDNRGGLKNPKITEKLLQISKIGVEPQDVPSYTPHDSLTFSLNNTLRISIDLTEKSVINKLLDMSIKTGLWKTFIYDITQERSIVIRLDLSKHDNIEDLKELSRYTIYPTRHKVFPPSGIKPYQVFSIPNTNRNYNLTMNPNDRRVTELLDNAYEKYPSSTIPKIPYLDIEDKLVKVPLTKQEFGVISKFSQIQINPLVVVPPNVRGPLLGLLIPINHDGLICITLDVNQESILNQLKPYTSNNTKDTTKIIFYIGKYDQVEVNMDLTNATVIETLKNISNNSGIRIISRRDTNPLLKICTIDFRCVIFDLQIPKVRKALVDISLDGGGTEIELRDEQGLVQPIHLPIINQTSFYLSSIEEYALLEYETKSPIPEYYVTLQNNEAYETPPIKIMHVNSKHPILLLDLRNAVYLGDTIGDIVIDLNIEDIYKNFTGRNTCNQTSCSLFQVQDVDGNIFSSKFDFKSLEDIKELKIYDWLSPINFRSVDFGLPVLIFEDVEVDLNVQEVVDLLQEFSANFTTQRHLKLQIPHGDDYIIVFIDFTNETLLGGLEAIQIRALDPYVYTIPEIVQALTTFNFTDGSGDIWTITYDMNDYFTRERFIGLSVNHKQFDIDYYTFPVVDNIGVTHTVSLNRFDTEILEYLKDLTYKTTGEEAQVIHKKEPKHLEAVQYTDMYGAKYEYILDMNDDLVLDNLDRLHQESKGVGVSINNPRSKQTFIINIEDPMIRIDLAYLMDVSLYGDGDTRRRRRRSIDNQIIKRKVPVKSFILRINTPMTGVFTFKFTNEDIATRDKLLELSIHITDSHRSDDSQHPYLKFDLENPKTLKELLILNSISKKLPMNYNVINKIARRFKTIQVCDPEEAIFHTIDLYDKNTITILNSMHRSTTGIRMEYFHKGKLITTFLDTSKIEVKSLLNRISMSIIPQHHKQKIKLITVIFLKNEQYPIVLNLANRATILKFMDLAKKYNQNYDNQTYFEIRDDTGQYLTLGLDLTNNDLIKGLLKTFKPRKSVEINHGNKTYLLLCFPNRNKVTKIQITRSSVTKLLGLPKLGFSVNLTGFLDSENLFFNLDSHQENLPEFGYTISPKISQNKFMSMFYNDHQIFLNIEDTKLIKYLKELSGQVILDNDNFPLSIINMNSTEQDFVLINMNDTIRKELKQFSQYHTAILIKEDSKKIIDISIGKKQIKLNLADPLVIKFIKDIKTNITENTIIHHLEDAWENPIVLKVDPNDFDTIGKLENLSTT